MTLYTKKEEMINMITHIIGAVFSVAVLITCIYFAGYHHSISELVSAIIYGLSMILLYLASSIYHGLNPDIKAKKIFQILDHCFIFVLIAGTYTPILLCNMADVSKSTSYILFISLWIITIIGIVLNIIDLKKFSKLSLVLYCMMGWCIIFKLDVLLEVMETTGIYLLVAGGVLYMIGVVFYILQKYKKYMHCIWHIFIILASICHYACILLFVFM